MTQHHLRGSWLVAGSFVLSLGLASPAFANHALTPPPDEQQGFPIPLGVSGSSQTLERVKGLLYCYAGTLGSLVRDNAGQRYILSNNHVLAKENENLEDRSHGSPFLGLGRNR